MKYLHRILACIFLVSVAFSAEAVERVIVTYPQTFGLVYIMGISDKIVGIPSSKLRIKDGKLGPFYSQYSPNLASATEVGAVGAVNMETVLKLQPDLIICSKSLPTAKETNQFFKDHNIRILDIEARFGSVDDWLNLVKLCCKEVGKPERGENYVNLWKKNLALVSERLGKIPENKRIKVTLINSYGGEITVRGSRSRFTIEMIKLAGGKVMDGKENPSDSSACAELVFNFDPDVLIDDYSETGNAPEWIQYLRASKNGRVLKMPYDDKQAWITNWTFNAFSPIGLVWLAKSFYPEEFADIDLHKIHEEFCNVVLGSPFHATEAYPLK